MHPVWFHLWTETHKSVKYFQDMFTGVWHTFDYVYVVLVHFLFYSRTVFWKELYFYDGSVNFKKPFVFPSLNCFVIFDFHSVFSVWMWCRVKKKKKHHFRPQSLPDPLCFFHSPHQLSLPSASKWTVPWYTIKGGAFATMLFPLENNL